MLPADDLQVRASVCFLTGEDVCVTEGRRPPETLLQAAGAGAAADGALALSQEVGH